MKIKYTESLAKGDQEDKQEYNDLVKASVADGSYFKDGLDWYFFRYVLPICDRAFLVLGSLVAAVIIYFLYGMIDKAFPLVQKEPVFIRSKDQSLYFPNIIALKPKEGTSYDPKIKTVDEAIAKYLLTLYVIDRESYDFSQSDVEEVNKKFNHIKNNSSSAEYKNFQAFMDKDNPDSPLKNFGKEVSRSVKIDSFEFITKEATDFQSRARDFIIHKIPTEAQVRFTATNFSVDENNNKKEEKERFLVKINFGFSGIDKDNNSVPISFYVNSYKIFKIR